jgi:hypothetical protein
MVQRRWGRSATPSDWVEHQRRNEPKSEQGSDGGGRNHCYVAQVAQRTIGAIASQVVVDETLHEVEDPPRHQHQPDVKPPRRRDASSSPVPNRGDHAGYHQQPRGEMEEAVRGGVHLQPRNRIDRIVIYMAHHVMPLEDLVKEDPVNETSQPQAEEHTDGPGRCAIWHQGGVLG